MKRPAPDSFPAAVTHLTRHLAIPASPSLNSASLANPVAGGVVSTSLDATTATTDGEGRFRLITQSNISSDKAQCYTLTAAQIRRIFQKTVDRRAPGLAAGAQAGS